MWPSTYRHTTTTDTDLRHVLYCCLVCLIQINPWLERRSVSGEQVPALREATQSAAGGLKGGLAMCDTWVALGDMTTTQSVIFAKNSDRPIFDCQPLVFTPRTSWPTHSSLQLEYIRLPQTDVTFATLGSSPYWCWGYEQGINEYRVAIGNEAIYTKTFRDAARVYQAGHPPALGLLGMDLFGLPLSAAAALQKRLTCLAAWSSAMASSARAFPRRITLQADMIMLFWSPIPTRPGFLKHSDSNGLPVDKYRAALQSPTRSVSERPGMPRAPSSSSMPSATPGGQRHRPPLMWRGRISTSAYPARSRTSVSSARVNCSLRQQGRSPPNG